MSNNNIIDGSGIIVPAGVSTPETKYTDPNNGSGLGSSPRSAAHGNILVTGDTTYSTHAGRALIYDTSSSSTSPIATINNPYPAQYDFFGQYIAMYGNYLAISVPNDDPSGHNGAGALFLYDISTPSSPSLMTTLNGTFPNQKMGGYGARFIMTSTSELFLVFQNNRTSSSDSTGQTFIYKMSDVQTNHTSTSLGTPHQTISETDFTAAGGLIRCTNDYMIQVVTDQPGNTPYQYRQYLRLRKFNPVNEQFEQFQDLYNYHEVDCSYTGIYPNVSQSTESSFCRYLQPPVDISSDGTILGIGIDQYKDPSHADGNAREGAFARYVLDTNNNQFVYNSITTWSDILNSGKISSANTPADSEYVWFGRGGVEYVDGNFVVAQGNNGGGTYGNNIVVFDEDGNVIDAKAAGESVSADYRAQNIVHSGSTVYWNAGPNMGSSASIIGSFSLTPGGARTITVTGDVQQGAFSPYAAGGYSYEFDGSSSITIPDATQLGAGDFSIEFWMKTSQTSVSLLNPETGSGAGTWGVYVDEGDLTFQESYMGGASAFTVDASSILDNSWHHVAICRSSATFAVYLDGISQSSKTGTFSNNTTDLGSVITGLMIGDGFKPDLNGSLNDLRIAVGTAVYTDNFTAPTSALTLTNETVLLTCNKPYMSAVGNAYSPASVSTTEVFTDAESATMIAGFTSSYPGMGSHRNLRISPNGEHTLIGAQNFRYSMYGNNVRGKAYLLSTDDLGNISHQSIDPPNYSQGGFSHGWSNAGAAVAVTDNHAAITAVRFSQAAPNHTSIDNAISNGTWPTSVASGWSWEPNVVVYALNNLSDYKFLATTGAVKTQVSMSGNYVAVADEGTAGGTYGSGIWVYDITDAAMTASAGTSFAPSGSGTYLDVANGDIVFPKYFIPRIGSASDYTSGYCTIHFSGDYIVRCAPVANNNGGRIEVYKFSDLVTIASGQTQVSPHATWNESTSGLKLGHWMRTDGTGIIASSGAGNQTGNIKVFDMDLNLLHTLNGSDYGSNAYFDDVSISTNYLMLGGRQFKGNTGGYLVLDRSDPSVVLKEGSGESSNDKMGHSVEIAQDETFFAHVSQLSSEYGELNLESMSVTPAGYSSASHTPTLIGDISAERSAPYSYVDYSAATHGGSAYFDGTGDRVNTAPTADFHFGTEDFTIEFWMKPIPNGYASSDHTVMSHSITSNTSNGWRIVYNESTKAIKWARGNGVHCNAAGLIEANVWNHVAITRANSTFGMFINGVIVTNSVYAESASYTPSTDLGLYIGGYDTNVESASASTSRNVFSGFLSDVRVVKGSAVYTADFTAPTAPLTAVTGTTLLLPFDDATIIDKSGSSLISVQGDVAVSDVAPPYDGGKSFTFDGTGDYVEAQDADISVSGDFTIEAWVKVSSASGNQQIVAFPGSSNDAGLLTSGASFVFADGTTNLISGGTVVVDQWHHVAVSRSSETVTLFVDGASVGTSSGHTATVGTSGDVNVGSDTSNGNLLTGELADIRIVESAVYTDTFTPPTGSYWD